MAAAQLRIRVERGMGVDAIGDRRAARPAWTCPAGCSGWRALRGDAKSIKAGVYELRAPITLAALLDRLVRGDVVLVEIAMIEGWTLRQMRAASTAPRTDARQRRSVRRGGAAQDRRHRTHPEGLFFPSTYRFSPGSSDLEIYREAYRTLKTTLETAWQARKPGLPLADPYQALVLASIVEKETGRDAERARIAAVFVNRLRLGMLLQSDPTTIYGLGDRFDGNLRKRDLQTDTPYNTYTRPGLPPTPIALPGRAAIQAALQPASITALYFVARGDGSSEFSDDLGAHNRAVARYQLKKRE